MTSLRRFWRALERPYGLCGVTAELRRLIGPELPAVAPLLRPLPVGSETYPCPTPGGDGCPRRVVMRGDGQLVALCGCSTYRSVQELQRAISVVQSSLNQQSGKRVRQYQLSGSKGI